MLLLHDPKEFPKSAEKIILGLGNFDGVHLGHQALLEEITTLITFSNHPSTILSKRPKQTILSLPHKLHLLEHYGVKTTLLLEFTQTLSQLSAEAFLRNIREHIPFTSLLLGYDARIGHNREGDEAEMQAIAKNLNFSLRYLKPIEIEGRTISSTLIRMRLEAGDFEGVSKLLGRSYSLRGQVIEGEKVGRLLGFKTINLSVEGLVLPPLGVYGVQVLHKQERYLGVANLGHAPTLKAHSSPLLEVHLLDFEEEIYDDTVEIIFQNFLRQERKFSSLEALQHQIAQDVAQARR